MPIEARCQNPECGVVLTLQGELAGKKVRCPKCGATIQVPAVESAPAQAPAPKARARRDSAAATAGPAAAGGAATCPKCGAALKPGVTFCSKCGARLGARPTPRKAPRPLRVGSPAKGLFVALGVAVLLAGGAVGALFLLRGERGKGAGEQPEPPPERLVEAPRVGPPPRGEAPARAKKERRKSKPSEFSEGLERLAAEAGKTRETIAAYFERLGEVAASSKGGSREQIAERWANLYVWCKEEGLHSEAEMCWLKAVRLAPQERQTNAMLGRTATFAGLPVEPEQKAFLDGIGSWLRVVNRHPGMEHLQVGLEGGEMQPLLPSESWDVRVRPGSVELVVKPAQGANARMGRITLMAEHGRRLIVSVLSEDLLPTVSSRGLRILYDALGTWRKYRNPEHPWPDERLREMGWQRIENGWQLSSGKEVLRFGTDGPYRLRSITLARRGRQRRKTLAQLSAMSETPLDKTPLDISLDQGRYRIVGELLALDRDGQKVTVAGTAERPLMLEVPRDSNWAQVRSGNMEGLTLGAAEFEAQRGIAFSYELLDEPVEAVERIMAALSEEYARSAEVRRLGRHHEGMLTEIKDLEARGELLGSWHSDRHLWEGIEPECRREWQRGRWQGQARALPPYARRLALLEVPDPQAYLYLEWPRFRRALALVVGPAAREVREHDVRLCLLPLMSEQDAVSVLRDRWGSLKHRKQRDALQHLRFMCGTPVIEFLAEIALICEAEDVRMATCLVLGDIGTPDALELCRIPTLKPRLRGAVLAALAGAGDQETVGSLSETLAEALPKVRTAFLPSLLKMRSPTVLPALSRVIHLYKKGKARAKIAEGLGEFGGHAAASLLARLIEEQDVPYAEAVGRFRPEEMTLLIEPLGKILRSGSAGSAEAALLLGETRAELAVPLLSAAALEDRQPYAALALAVHGSAQTLERAARAAELIGVEELEIIRDLWRKGEEVEQEDGPWEWHPDIDRRAAAEFLQAVLRESKRLDAKMKAAKLLVEVGEKPELEGLLAVVSMAVPEEKPEAERAGVPGPSGRWGAGDRPGRPGGMEGPFGPAPLTAEQRLELRMEAVELLEKVTTPEIAAELRKLAETAKSAEIRFGALQLLARLADEENLAYLQELAVRPPGKYADLEAALNHTRSRIAAVTGLVAAGHPEAVSKLHELWFEPEPQLEDFEKAPAGKHYSAALKKRKQLVREGVCEAVLALPSDTTLWVAARVKTQARELAGEFRNLAEQGARSVKKAPEVQKQTALAIRCLGRAGELSPLDWRTLEVLAKEEVPLPGLLRRAVADTLVSIEGLRAAALLASMSSSMQEESGLSEHWNGICLKLASHGGNAKYKTLIQALDTLPESVIQQIVETMSRRKGWAPLAYYELLARVAALPVEFAYRSPPNLYADALEGKSPLRIRQLAPEGLGFPGAGFQDLEEWERLEERRMREQERRTQPVSRQPWLARLSERKAKQKQKEKAAGVRARGFPGNQRYESIKLRSRCLKLLGRGPDDTVVRLLEDEEIGLQDHEVFGPWVALMIRQRAPDFDIVEYLQDRFEVNVSLKDSCAVAAVARKVGSQEAIEMLSNILLRQQEAETQETQAEGRRRLELPYQRLLAQGGRIPPGELDRLGKQHLTPEDKNATMCCVGRALGSLGDYDSLRKGLVCRVVKSRIEYRYPEEVRAGALAGLPYLPPEKGPVAVFQRLKRLHPDPKVRQACIEGMLTAFRLREKKTGESAEGAARESGRANQR